MVGIIFCFLLQAGPAGLNLPYAQAGLSDREAAAHLLDRFAFGARSGEVDRVAAMGPAQWLATQIEGVDELPILDSKLEAYTSLEMSTQTIAETYPGFGRLKRMASMQDMDLENLNKREQRRLIRTMFQDEGLRPQRELLNDLAAWKWYRAQYSENQLREKLTEFWFNHFFVSRTNNKAKPFILTYERDAIQPYVLGNFGDMLEEAACHPAMLLYLDNAFSGADEETKTTMDMRRPQRRRHKTPRKRDDKKLGINENYARELLELHTLGVDGGYTQKDVEEVARAFTGWTVFPPDERGERLARRLDRATRLGFHREEMFLFRADRHDAGPKTILGRHFPAGGGVEEGEAVLEMLAKHPSTARFIAQKFARRFTKDQPEESLVARLEQSFISSGGNLKELLRVLVTSPEFWQKSAVGAKVKSPFELAVSAVRALDGEVTNPSRLIWWIERMGQPMYAYQAPTGYPDDASFWINSGALLHRMDFALALAHDRIAGVTLPTIAARTRVPGEQLAENLAPTRNWAPTLTVLQAELDPTISKTKQRLMLAGLLLGSPEFQKY